MAKRGNRVQVILECTEHKTSGVPGTSRYITTKNKRNTPDRKSGKGNNFTKVIKMVKSPKTGSYAFKEEIVHNDHVKDFLSK